MVVFVVADCLVGNGGSVVGSFVSVIDVGCLLLLLVVAGEVFLTFQR